MSLSFAVVKVIVDITLANFDSHEVLSSAGKSSEIDSICGTESLPQILPTVDRLILLGASIGGSWYHFYRFLEVRVTYPEASDPLK